MKGYCKRCSKVIDEVESQSGFCYHCYDEEALESINYNPDGNDRDEALYDQSFEFEAQLEREAERIMDSKHERYGDEY